MDPEQFAARLRTFSAEQSIQALSRPVSRDSRLGRRTPVPIVIPPKYDEDAPHKGLGGGVRHPVSLNSAASTNVDSVFSPGMTDGTQTPLTSLGSPGFLSPLEDEFRRKQSIDDLIRTEDRPPVSPLLHAVDEQESSPTSTVRPASHLEITESGQNLEQELEAARISAWSSSSEDITNASDSSSTYSYTRQSIVATKPSLVISEIQESSEPPTHTFDPSWEFSSEARFLDRAGNDARSRRSRRSCSPSARAPSPASSMRNSRAMDAPIPVSFEDLPQRPMTSASREKIAIESFDDGKIFVPETFNALPPPPPLQPPSMSHFSWSSARPASSGDAQPSRSYRDIFPSAHQPSVARPTLFAYAQSRHEYSKARRLNFHFRSPSSMARQNMQVDPTNTNPSVFAAELYGESAFEGHMAVEAPSEIHPARQYHFYPAPSLHTPGGRSRSLSSKSSRGRMGAATPAPTTPGKSSKTAFFQSAFGQCFGRRS
ncbi:uncharacterized protein K489DRAFT_234486 [Dissoconium aciculare CBS 342.82]|uniref:Uncharacterized protein n=1 Tax=Dissoconium aciculare CBS 342.82 TaxID=1314786 RepID=A0A6J3M2C0_9PEZI|nr:uncharacterized protein K489DRAFT_234486 [Dissoconium aciculare CBS 342.82]KAF1822156.1 hypothetical protein K489DRAFT_234486 [Dissoconium aciculare CBS 342.82]